MKKRGVYYYRRHIPKAPNGEIVLSLRTRLFREAECLGQEFRRLVQDVTTTDGTDVAVVLREYIKRRLDFDMWQRAEPDHGNAVQELVGHLANLIPAKPQNKCSLCQI